MITDAKRGDVGSTNEAYAEAFLGADAPLAADALTVHPYLGLAAMEAFVTRATDAGSCLLVVTRSSNPEGRTIQSALDPAGRSVEEGLLEEIGVLNRQLGAGRDRSHRRRGRPHPPRAESRPGGGPGPVPGSRRRGPGGHVE